MSADIRAAIGLKFLADGTCEDLPEDAARIPSRAVLMIVNIFVEYGLPDFVVLVDGDRLAEADRSPDGITLFARRGKRSSRVRGDLLSGVTERILVFAPRIGERPRLG